jgi:hypothetical protein
MEFVISIDTEADNQWDHGRKLTVENIKYIPRFQDLCSKYGISPTYLVTSEVCDDPYARQLFSAYLRHEQAEVGAHLHSWTTPPFLDRDGYRYNDVNHAFAYEFSDELLYQKIKYLTRQITTSFGERPTSFRSGRFGFNEKVARMLVMNGYLVDSSVTPYTNWNYHRGLPEGQGGPDFLDKTPFPYTYDFDAGTLMEIPVTILPTRFPINRYDSFARSFFSSVDKNIMLRIIRRLLYKNQPLWLRPHPRMDLSLFQEIIEEAEKIKLPYLVMMFHSSELMPGCSIYRTDADSIEKLYELLEGFFVLVNDKHIKSVVLTEAIKKVTV